MEEKRKKEKKDFYLVESNSDTGKRNEKKFSNTKLYKLFTNFTIIISSFCLVLCCTYSTIFYFLFIFYIVIYTTFTIYDTFHSILSLNDARDITNFTTYVLQIGLSPITKKKKTISKIYSLYFLSNTNHIFTPSVCKFFSSYELVIFVYLF